MIHELFEQQVARTPNAVAVVYEGGKLTYQELNEKSNQLAHFLQKRGIGPESLVGICIERSPDMIIGLFGILKAGGAYVHWTKLSRKPPEIHFGEFTNSSAVNKRGTTGLVT
ncbi:AMP-binding protein [Bacillus sp. A17A.1]